MYASLASTFLLPEEALADSPSRKAGVSAELEAQLRLYGCELIQEAGCLLKLSQAVMATGQVLLHRFYCKRPLTKYDVKVWPWETSSSNNPWMFMSTLLSPPWVCRRSLVRPSF